jgi:UDP-N-acetylmuramoyl-L-alanyl-D-glutamate--2,6-diaminopimelate ligase
VHNARAAVGPVAALVFRSQPMDEAPLVLIGVTGTNGKTTTTYFANALLAALGHRTGLIGTIEIVAGGEAIPSRLTTPESTDVHALLALMRERGVTAASMEVSSHAIEYRRIDGVHYDVVGFTNLTQDHLDLHGTMEEYFAAKRSLFAQADRAVINAADEYGRRLAAELPNAVTFTPEDPLDADVHLAGSFNRTNAVAAAAAARAYGIDEAAIRSGIGDVRHVPGRFEAVDEGQPFSVLVDYSHKPGALATVLHAARELTDGRVLCVFGAGGDRDREKRPLMGRVAAELADVVIVTTDNPRSEDPVEIAREIVGDLDLDVELDRRLAIERAIAEAREGDVVLIAGKGHERGQEFADRTIPFDDREIAREALRRLRTPV